MALKSSMKILVCDETGSTNQIIRKMLSDIGFKNVVQASDGEKAWDIIVESVAEKPVELVISEWNLPKVSGIDLLKKVRANTNTDKTKFLMITNDADQQNVITAVKTGVSNVMVKPFSGNTLMEKIGKAFGTS